MRIFNIFDIRYTCSAKTFIIRVKEFSDIEIIDCLRKRESYVVRYLSERYLPVIRLMVFQNGGTADDANDIFQDGLIIMLEKIDDGEFELRCKFKTYLYCVCENLWKTVLDKRRAAANYLDALDESESETQADFTELIDHQLYQTIFREVFETLDQKTRNILNLYWQNVSNQEIAVKLGITYGYVRKMKCEAQNELTAKIKRHPEYIRLMNSDRIAREVVR